jgi:hypothetical protein
MACKEEDESEAGCGEVYDSRLQVCFPQRDRSGGIHDNPTLAAGTASQVLLPRAAGGCPREQGGEIWSGGCSATPAQAFARTGCVECNRRQRQYYNLFVADHIDQDFFDVIPHRKVVFARKLLVHSLRQPLCHPLSHLRRRVPIIGAVP